jgi:hypothetical protein
MANKLKRCVTSLDERTGTITGRDETQSQHGIYIALIIMEEPLVEPNRDEVVKGKRERLPLVGGRAALLAEEGAEQGGVHVVDHLASSASSSSLPPPPPMSSLARVCGRWGLSI